MAKKKKTLPKDFDELLKKNDFENLKKVFDTCELDARGGYNKETALSFYDVPDELVRWLVGNGADINAVNYYQRTALHKNAGIRGGNVAIFLELGANLNAVDNDGDTALHFATGQGFNANAVKDLIKYGANINALNNENQTPLEYALRLANNMDLVSLVEISKILLPLSSGITQNMKDLVTRRGEDFEFHRENFNKDDLAETDKALNELYDIYEVQPVKKRVVHDGISTIKVTGTTWKKQYEELWELLIPSKGSAKTVQGEVVRIAGRVRDEINRNGGANWNSDFKKMLDAFYSHLSSGISLQIDELEKASLIINDIRKDGMGEDDELQTLCELATKWVVINPNPIALNKPNYSR